jgi:hypothetical protein
MLGEREFPAGARGEFKENPFTPEITTMSALKFHIGRAAIAFVLLLAACADDAGERVAGSAAMGGALGIPAGPIGIAVGAGIGAAAGALVPKTVLEGSAPEAAR